MTSLWRALLAYGLGFLIFFAAWSLIEQSAQEQYAALVSRGVQTAGKVTAYGPSNHDDLEYTFTVDGQRYVGGGAFHIAGRFEPGQQVQVVYERNHPTNSCACDPKAELANADATPIVGGLWLGLLFPGWYLGQRYFRLRPPKQASDTGPTESSANQVGTMTSTATGQSRRTRIKASLPSWFWTSGTIEYSLVVPPEEALRRLAAGVKADTLVRSFVPVVGLLGWVQGNRFQLTTRTPFVSNSFDSILEGRILPATGGSRLAARFRVRKAVVGCMVIWIVFAAVLGTLMAVSTILAPQSWHPGPPPVWLPLLFPGFGIALVLLARGIAVFQERRLLSLLDAILGLH